MHISIYRLPFPEGGGKKLFEGHELKAIENYFIYPRSVFSLYGMTPLMIMLLTSIMMKVMKMTMTMMMAIMKILMNDY